MQRLDGSEPQHIVDDIRDELAAPRARDQERILLDIALDVAVDDLLDLPRVLMGRRQDLLLRERHLVDDPLVDALPDEQVGLLSRIFLLIGGKDPHLVIFAVFPAQPRK